MGGEVVCGSSVYFWIYAGILDPSSIFRWTQPSIVDFAAAARRAFFAGLAAAFLARRLRKGAYSDAI